MVEVTFNSDFNYSSISLADFTLQGFELVVYDDPNPSVTQADEILGDFSAFQADLSLINPTTHFMEFVADLNPTAFAGSYWINPIPVSTYPNLEVFVYAWQFAGSHFAQVFRRGNGLGTFISPLATTIPTSVTLTPTISVAVGSVKQPIDTGTVVNGLWSGTDSIEASRLGFTTASNQNNKGNITNTLGGGLAFSVKVPGLNPDKFKTAKDVCVFGNGSDTLSIALLDGYTPAIPNSTANVIATATAGSKQAVAACMISDTKIAIFFNGQIRTIPMSYNVLTGFNLLTNLTEIFAFSGYYVERMFFDIPTNTVYFLGLPGASTIPASYTQLNLYKTTTSFTTPVLVLSNLNILRGVNKGVTNLNNSRLYMFDGHTIDFLFDASTEQLIDTSSRVVDGLSFLSNNFLVSGASRRWLGDPYVFALIRTSNPSNHADWTGSIFKLVRILAN